MSTNSEIIAVTEIKQSLSKEKPIEENFKIAAKEAKNHWLTSQYHDEKRSFHIAVMALGSFYGQESPEFERISQEMKFINTMFFTPSNVPVDMVQMLEGMDKDIKPIGLMKIWKEIK